MATALEIEKKYTNAIFLLGGIISLVFGILLIARTQGTIEVIMLLVAWSGRGWSPRSGR